MSDAIEWVYEYKIKTPWLNIALLRKNLRRHIGFDDTPRLQIEYKRNGEWRFAAIGDPSSDKIFLETISKILNNYAK